MEKRLYRSHTDRMIWGVCGGIANYFGIDPTIIRIIAVLLTVLSAGGAILAYIVLAMVVPSESSTPREPREVIRENVEEIKQTAANIGEDMRSTFSRPEGATEGAQSNTMHHGPYFIAIILIIIGVIFLLGNFLSWLSWKFLWPLIIIAVGLLIMFSPRRK